MKKVIMIIIACMGVTMLRRCHTDWICAVALITWIMFKHFELTNGSEVQNIRTGVLEADIYLSALMSSLVLFDYFLRNSTTKCFLQQNSSFSGNKLEQNGCDLIMKCNVTAENKEEVNHYQEWHQGGDKVSQQQ